MWGCCSANEHGYVHPDGIKYMDFYPDVDADKDTDGDEYWDGDVHADGYPNCNKYGDEFMDGNGYMVVHGDKHLYAVTYSVVHPDGDADYDVLSAFVFLQNIVWDLFAQPRPCLVHHGGRDGCGIGDIVQRQGFCGGTNP